MPSRSFGSSLPFSQKPLAAHHEGALGGGGKHQNEVAPMSVDMYEEDLPAAGWSIGDLSG